MLRCFVVVVDVDNDRYLISELEKSMLKIEDAFN
jgi:hypothetical protein